MALSSIFRWSQRACFNETDYDFQLMKRTILVLVLACVSSGFTQSTPTQPSSQPPTPPANQAKVEDVNSLEAILAATYDVISGPAGKKRDWDRFRSLFYPGARLIPTGKRANESEVKARVLSPEEYIERSAPFLEKEGFFERGFSNKIEHYANIAHVFSTYESRHKADDAQPFQRGINSFQLVNDGKRWWVITILWQGETPDNPIPAEYLKAR
jgi:hypothetical protein